MELLSIRRQDYILSKKYPREEERLAIEQGFNPEKRTPEEIKAIKQGKCAARDVKSKLIFNLIGLWKPFRFWSGYRNFPDGRFFGPWSLKHNASSIICYGLLLPFMILSIGYLVFKRAKIVFFLTFPLLIQTLLHLLQHGRERYRVPVDSFIIILGTMGMVILWDIVRKPQKG